MTFICYYSEIGGDDDAVILWDVKEGRLIHSLEGLGSKAQSVAFCCKDRLLLASFTTKLVAIDCKTIYVRYTIDIKDAYVPYCVGGDDRKILGIFYERTVSIYDADNGTKLDTIEPPKLGTQQMSESSMEYPGYAIGKIVKDMSFLAIYMYYVYDCSCLK